MATALIPSLTGSTIAPSKVLPFPIPLLSLFPSLSPFNLNSLSQKVLPILTFHSRSSLFLCGHPNKPINFWGPSDAIERDV